MNGRPKTTQFPDMLRRPLLWAALCSLVLHVPLLGLWSLQISKKQPPFAEDMLLLLLPDAVASQVAESEQGEAPVSQVASDPGNESVQRQFVQAPALNHTLVDSPASINNHVTGTAQTAGLQTRSDNFLPNSAVIAPAAIEIVEPLQTPVTATADNSISLQALAAATTPLPMAGRDRQLMEAAIQNLLDHINRSGIETGLSTIAQLGPESLGLLAADQITTVAIPASALTALQQVDVTVTRRINGRPFQVRARLQERALSHYAKFVNRWDDKVMLSNDHVDGRFHANSEVNFEVAAHARPQFNGEVTIASRQPVALRLRQSEMFADGIRTGIGRIAVPRDSLPAHWLDTGATVLELESHARLEFQGHHGVLWTDTEDNRETQLQVPDAGLVIIGDGRTRIELSGTVSGQVLVYSPHQLLITGSVLYADTSPDSDDTLALVSDGSIEIAPTSVTGSGDLQIHGALFARQRFSVRRFRERHQGTLYIYGSLVAGSVSATEPRFHTHIRYDQRFEHSRPPAFPSAGLFDLVAWDQHWSAANDADALFADVADSAPLVVP